QKCRGVNIIHGHWKVRAAISDAANRGHAAYLVPVQGNGQSAGGSRTIATTADRAQNPGKFVYEDQGCGRPPAHWTTLLYCLWLLYWFRRERHVYRGRLPDRRELHHRIEHV